MKNIRMPWRYQTLIKSAIEFRKNIFKFPANKLKLLDILILFKFAK
jgi:hypothetical protein